MWSPLMAFAVIAFTMPLEAANMSNDREMSIDEAIINSLESSHMSSANLVRVELDMLFRKDSLKARMRRQSHQLLSQVQNGKYSEKFTWPNAVVPYKLDVVLPADGLLERAMDEYRKYTCVRFREASADDTTFLRIVDNRGCSFLLDSGRGVHELSLATDCRQKNTVIHELGHAIGLLHEHSRSDRDDYVSIDMQNIKSDYKNDFHISTVVESLDTNIPYDYLSIMHYSQEAAAINKSGNVLRTKDPKYQELIGRRRSLSFRDAKRINSIYECSEKMRCPPKYCPGEGYVGQDCRCWCPSNDNDTTAEHCPQDGEIVKVELDMLFTATQLDTWKSRVNDTQSSDNLLIGEDELWPNATVPIFMRANFSISGQELMRRAIDQFQRYSCLRFHNRTGDEVDYIEIVEADGCSSFVGKKGGAQPLSLAPWCIGMSVIVHELGHAIGLVHRHSQPKGNAYVSVNASTIPPEFIAYLSKSSLVESEPGKSYYEYLKIMYRHQFVYSNRKYEIKAEDSEYLELIGLQGGLSFSDAKLINRLYACAERNRCQQTLCPGEGFVGQDCLCWCRSTDNEHPAKLCTNHEGAVKVELDMLFTAKQWDLRQSRTHGPQPNDTSAIDQNQLWPNATIPYKISANLSIDAELALTVALAELQRYSCLRFFERTEVDDDYIEIIDEDGCFSFVGKKGGAQSLSLAPSCIEGLRMDSLYDAILHELSHALGVEHEHNRPDRDLYITINVSNVQEHDIHAFHKVDSSGLYKNVSYNYLSVMHYSEKVFSKNGLPTILARNSSHQKLIGKHRGFTFDDIKRLNMMYQCSEKRSCLMTSCLWDGFVGEDCQCWCPSRKRTVPAVRCTEAGAVEKFRNVAGAEPNALPSDDQWEMRLTKFDKRSTKDKEEGTIHTELLPNKTINFTLQDNKFLELDIMRLAIKQFQNFTCLHYTVQMHRPSGDVHVYDTKHISSFSEDEGDLQRFLLLERCITPNPDAFTFNNNSTSIATPQIENCVSELSMRYNNSVEISTFMNLNVFGLQWTTFNILVKVFLVLFTTIRYFMVAGFWYTVMEIKDKGCILPNQQTAQTTAAVLPTNHGDTLTTRNGSNQKIRFVRTVADWTIVRAILVVVSECLFWALGVTRKSWISCISYAITIALLVVSAGIGVPKSDSTVENKPLMGNRNPLRGMTKKRKDFVEVGIIKGLCEKCGCKDRCYQGNLILIALLLFGLLILLAWMCQRMYIYTCFREEMSIDASSQWSYKNLTGMNLTFSFDFIKETNINYQCAGRSNCSKLIQCPDDGYVGQDCKCWCPSGVDFPPAVHCKCMDFGYVCGYAKSNQLCTLQPYKEYLKYSCPRSCGYCEQ